MLQTNLDSSVGTQLQYLLSSMPVMDNPFADIDMQTLPAYLSTHTNCKELTMNKIQLTKHAKEIQMMRSLIPSIKKEQPYIRSLMISRKQWPDDSAKC